MNHEESIRLVNGYMLQMDRRAGQLEYKPGETVSGSYLTYQGIKVEVGVVLDDRGNSHALLSIGLVATPRKNREAFFKQLLRWNNFVSGIGHFALGNDENSVFLVCRRPVVGLDMEEFETMVTNMTESAAGAVQLINQMFR